MAVAAPRRRAHGDEHRARTIECFRKVGSEGKPSRLDVARDQLIESWFVDRHLSGLEPVDLGCILVDADHVVSEIGKACAGNQSDIARSHHCNLQEESPILWRGSPMR